MIAPKEVALIFLLGCVIYVVVKSIKILVEELKLKQIKKLVKKMKKGDENE